MDELEISGKRYISSRRAAKENKYHSDYIGQLVRTGKVVGTKVGRAWYVDENSLSQYLGKEKIVQLSTPVAPTVSIEVKKEIHSYDSSVNVTSEDNKKTIEVPKPVTFPTLRYITEDQPLSYERPISIEVPLRIDNTLKTEITSTTIGRFSQQKKSIISGPFLLVVLAALGLCIGFGPSYFLHYQMVVGGHSMAGGVEFTQK
jgi:hypothetical protein